MPLWEIQMLTPEQIGKIREKYGLNDPWYEQYGRWITKFVQGDMGQSYVHQQPVTQLLAGKLGNTVLLVAMYVNCQLFNCYYHLELLQGDGHDSWADKLIVRL